MCAGSMELNLAESSATDGECSEGVSPGAGERTPRLVASAGFTFRFFSVAYLSRLMICVVLFLGTGYINAFASVVAGHRSPQIDIIAPGWAANQTSLPDLGHDLVSVVGRKLWGKTFLDWFTLPDIFLELFMVAVVALCIVHPLRFLILRRFCIVFAALNGLRALCVILTSLPDASPACASQFGDKKHGAYKQLSWKTQYWYTHSAAMQHSMRRAWRVAFEPGRHITCGDLVFSGHATAMTMCTLVFTEYCHPSCWTVIGRDKVLSELSCWLIRWLVVAVNICGQFAILATKLHYSLDIFLANFLTLTCWRAYHHAIAHSRLKGQFRILKWLEAEEVMKIDIRAYRNWVENPLRSSLRKRHVAEVPPRESTKERDKIKPKAS